MAERKCRHQGADCRRRSAREESDARRSGRRCKIIEARRIEGLWDCVYCGQKAIRARFDTCMSCGKPRGIENVFYLPEDPDAAVLTQEEKAGTTNAPDWLCGYCGSYNRADVSCCVKCGGDRAESKLDYGMLHKLTGRLFGRRD